MHGVTETCAQTLGTNSHKETGKNIYFYTCPETFNLCVIAEGVHLYYLLRMPSMMFSARLMDRRVR
jgi:hypothetical protein